MSYYTELGRSIYEKRGGQQEVSDQLNTLLKPEQIGSINPPTDAVITVGYNLQRPASFIIAGVQVIGNEVSRKMIKVVPVLEEDPIYTLYDSFQHTQYSLFNETVLLKRANPYMNVYAAHLLPSLGMPIDVIALGKPLKSVDEIDPRYPIGIVMPEYDIGTTASLKDKSEAGEIKVLNRLKIGEALAEFHMNRTTPLLREHAYDVASFEPLKNKITANANYFMESLVIRQEMERNVKLIDEIWNVERHTEQFSRVYNGIFNRHWQKFARILQNRIDQEHVRDIHGDMKSEHVVYTADGIPYGARVIDYWQFLDRAVFNETYGFGDVLGDLAHLTVDMESWIPKQYRNLISQIRRSYFKTSGQDLDMDTMLLLSVLRWDKANVRYCSKVRFKGETEGTRNYLEVAINNMGKLDAILRELDNAY